MIKTSRINWEKPKQARSTEEHNAIHSSDSGIGGTYVPNMSDKDAYAWKGKIINRGKPDARVELRKTFSGGGNLAQVLIILTKDGMKISTNGAIQMMFDDWNILRCVVDEAQLMRKIVK